MPLIVDRSQRAAPVGDGAFADWAASQAVFLSSEMSALRAERRSVAARLRALGLQVIMFEDLGGRDDDAQTAYIDGVAHSDVYVGLVADRYGTMLASGRSPTHEEYLEARRRGLKIAVWAAADDTNRQGHARDFVAEVRTFHTTGAWSTPDTLAEAVLERMRELAAEDESPWIKLGDVVARATEIEDDGRQLTVQVASRDPQVLAALEALRPDGWQRSSEVPVAVSDRSGSAKVTEVRSRTVSATRRELTVVADVTWADGRRSSSAMGINGISFEEQIEAGLRAGLFGEPLPERLGMLAGAVDASDPLEPLDALDLPHASYEAIGRLLLVERLLGAGGASHVQHVGVGPLHGGTRVIEVGWRDPLWATNVEPRLREISGTRRKR